MREPDFYAALGVEPDADAAAIRAAYRRAAREHHPDRGGSAEEFHRVQQAWEVLGSAASRADYDRRRSGSAGSAASPAASETTEEGPGFTYSRSAAPRRAAERAADTRTRGRTARRSANADLPPVYQPPLSEPQPLNLALTSQKVHGSFPARGLFGGGRTARRHQLGTEILEKHVLDSLAAARLFNDVHLTPLPADKKAQRRAAKSSARVDHVLLCGRTLVLVSTLEVPTATASWDGRSLRAAGRSIPLPDLAAQAKQLSGVLTHQLQAQFGQQTDLTVDFQHVLLAADGDLFHPVVEAVGAGRLSEARRGPGPLAAGRAIGHLANVLGASDQANLVDRRLMALLRGQLAAPDAD